jgi:hypothetical protein
MSFNESVHELLFELAGLEFPELGFQLGAEFLSQFFEGGAIAAVFGEFIIEGRQNFILDLANRDGKLCHLSG